MPVKKHWFVFCFPRCVFGFCFLWFSSFRRLNKVSGPEIKETFKFLKVLRFTEMYVTGLNPSPTLSIVTKSDRIMETGETSKNTWIVIYIWFHKKGIFSVHSFNDDYLSIPEHQGSFYLYVPFSWNPRYNNNKNPTYYFKFSHLLKNFPQISTFFSRMKYYSIKGSKKTEKYSSAVVNFLRAFNRPLFSFFYIIHILAKEDK